MNPRLLFVVAAILGLAASPVRAQFDFNKLTKAIDKAKTITDTAKDASKVAKGAAGIGPEEEKVIGDSVALEVIGKFGGLVRDEDISRRVNLVGRALARYSARPEHRWRFGVLASPTVNAFSAPDGYVFITPRPLRPRRDRRPARRHFGPRNHPHHAPACPEHRPARRVFLR